MDQLRLWLSEHPVFSKGIAIAIAWGLNTGLLAAHENESLAPHDIATAWTFEPGIVIPLLLSAWLYLHGVWILWREIGPGRGIRRWEASAFAGGWLALVLALVSPLHPMGSVLFSAHMAQHEVLMLLAAPLLVLGRPLIPFLWALPVSWRRQLGAWGNAGAVRLTWRTLTRPAVAWSVHGAVIWLWHAPSLFQATLTSEIVHTLQHASFLGSALLFCWALLDGRDRRSNHGVSVFYLFTTAVHTSILGALLTFAHTLWYPLYRETTSAWGLTPLEDQQLGGLIMWIPAGALYMIAGLILFATWIRAGSVESEAAHD
jgi:putative membrane protein